MDSLYIDGLKKATLKRLGKDLKEMRQGYIGFAVGEVGLHVLAASQTNCTRNARPQVETCV